MIKNGWSQVEKEFLKSSGRQDSYANEKIPVIEVQNIYELGTTHSLAHSLAHSLIHSLTHSFTHSLTHSLR
jgi:hypothetical protein